MPLVLTQPPLEELLLYPPTHLVSTLERTKPNRHCFPPVSTHPFGAARLSSFSTSSIFLHGLATNFLYLCTSMPSASSTEDPPRAAMHLPSLLRHLPLRPTLFSFAPFQQHSAPVLAILPSTQCRTARLMSSVVLPAWLPSKPFKLRTISVIAVSVAHPLPNRRAGVKLAMPSYLRMADETLKDVTCNAQAQRSSHFHWSTFSGLFVTAPSASLPSADVH